jgi:hypothetical protein
MTAFETAVKGLSQKEKDSLYLMQIYDGKELSLRQKLFILCWEIENLPASDQQTKVSTLACELRSDIFSMQGNVSELVRKLREVENSLWTKV